MSGTLAEALKSPQGFVTGSLELDANYSTGWLSSTNRGYGVDNSAKLYVDPGQGTNIVYDTLAGGFPFPDANRNVYGGYKGWSQNSLEARRALRYLLPGETNDRFPDFELDYVSYGIWFADSRLRYDPETLQSDRHEFTSFFHFGIPTPSTDIPQTGSAAFRGIAEGKVYDLENNYELKGTATLFADFATGSIQTSLVLEGFSLENGLPANVGSLEGAAFLASGTGSFRGSWVSSSNGYEGSIIGAFYGPSAAEFGYSFGINKPDLSAIGGGVVVGGQDTSPTPPTPPTPPQPSPPPPAPAGSTFPLSGPRTFEAVSSTTRYKGSAISGGVTLQPGSSEGPSSQRTITVTPDYEHGTYTVRLDGETSTFMLSDPTQAPNPNTVLVTLSDGSDDRLLLFNNLQVGIGTNDIFLQLHYLSFAFLFRNDPETTERTTTALLFGSMTPNSSVPRSGTAVYTTQGAAYALKGYGTYADVQGKLTANFGAGTVENKFSVSNYRGASITPFYRFAGTGTISSDSALFSGTLTGGYSSENLTLTGTFTGSFFGDAAQEAGFTFEVSGTDAGEQQVIVGAAGGKH